MIFQLNILTRHHHGIIEIADHDTLRYFTQEITKPTSIDGYTPINKKLLTGEFNYLVVSNNNGVSSPYYYELFDSQKATFSITGVPTMRLFNKFNTK